MKNVDEAIALLAEWARKKLDSQQEPPWAWEQYNQLLAVLVDIGKGRNSTISLQDSLLLAEHSGNADRRGDCIVELDTLRCHSGKLRPQMPT